MKKIVAIFAIFFSLLFLRNSNIASADEAPRGPLGRCDYIYIDYGVYEFQSTIRWSWSYTGVRNYWLQIRDLSNNRWYKNEWIWTEDTPPSFISRNMPADRPISARFRWHESPDNLSPWSEDTTITCASSPTPTLRPTRTPTPTPTRPPTPTSTVTPTPTETPTPLPTQALAQPQTPTGTCGHFNPSTGFFSITWSWPKQPTAWKYWFLAFDKAKAEAFANREVATNSFVTDRIAANVKIRAMYSWKASDYVSQSPMSQQAEVTCTVPTATPTPTPTRIPMADLKLDRVTIINGYEPEVVISNVGDYTVYFSNFPVNVAINCWKADGTFIPFCSSKGLWTIQESLEVGETMTVRLRYLASNIVSYQPHIDSPAALQERSTYNNWLPKTTVPVPTATPTPTSSPLPDLKIESITFDAKTRVPTMKIKNNERMARMIFSNTSGGYVTAQFIWHDSANNEVGRTRLNIPPDRILEPGETMTLTAFGHPPYTAVSYWAMINRPEVLEESNNNNNTNFGDLPVLTPTPISPIQSLTPTTIPTNTPIPNITSPSPTPVDKKQSVLENLNYPIAELGNCKDKEDCANYCDVPANLNACNEYSVKMGLRTREEAERIRNATNVKSGPGGCNSQENCAAFCDKPENLNLCLDYAEKNNMMSVGELDKTKKVLTIISSGNKTPGNCKTPKQCQSYCTGGAHIEECLEFARGAGIISGDEAHEIKKGTDFLKTGGPGGCKSREECESYCDDENHQTECENFFKNVGMDSKSKEQSGKPPNTGGGAVCTSLEECKTFCANPANAEACKNVVIKEGTMSGPTIQGNMQELLQNIAQMPEESKECLKQKLGVETFNTLMRGELPTTPINGDVMQFCFTQGVQEYEQKMMPTKKPDDWDMTSSYLQISPTPQVQGISTSLSLLDMFINWFKK